ncbi:DUF2796 domain-containing protein [Hellea balneolensis]|uniref:DUF2796 domain-containing protein n=1 Tax=Hellea balneolensis TaxID=287478 RepID=UPI0004175E34|nr:DUF2796 domain-containing protein [Hellea balneolensis]
MKQLPFFKITQILIAGLFAACSESNDTVSTDHLHQDPISVKSDDNLERNTTDETDTAAKKTINDGAARVTRSADKHAHGDAELGIVLEDGTVTIEFESPLYNILGFEHSPESDAQRKTVKRAESQLSRGAELFEFNDEAGCKTTSEDMAVKLFNEHEHNTTHDDHHQEEDHDHDKEHSDHEDHAEEDEHSDHEFHDEDTHKDVLLNYEFVCMTPSSLSNVNINIFRFFEDLSDIDVTYLGPSTQKQVNLTPKSTEMDLSR